MVYPLREIQVLYINQIQRSILDTTSLLFGFGSGSGFGLELKSETACITSFILSANYQKWEKYTKWNQLSHLNFMPHTYLFTLDILILFTNKVISITIPATVDFVIFLVLLVIL